MHPSKITLIFKIALLLTLLSYTNTAFTQEPPASFHAPDSDVEDEGDDDDIHREANEGYPFQKSSRESLLRRILARALEKTTFIQTIVGALIVADLKKPRPKG